MDLNLELIKKEIESSKSQKKRQAVTEGHDIPMAADEFLYNLKNAVETGQPNKATAKLGVVQELSESMKLDETGQIVGKKPVNEVINNHMNATQQPRQQPNPQPKQPHVNQNQLEQQADENFYKNLQETQQLITGNKTNNAGLADAMAQYTNMGSTRTNPQSQPINNPNYLIEQVNNAVHTYFQSSNVVNIIEQAVKNTMMEIYEKEKLASALNENKDMIQKIVVDTIISLKKRNQAQTTK